MKNFCVVPWYGREIDLNSGKERICCWIGKNISREELQRKFLSEDKPLECTKCWHSEENGFESRRQMENRFLDFKLNRDIGLIEQDVRDGKVYANIYQLFLGSVCNATCVTCGPLASLAWRSLLDKNTISIRQENAQIDQHFETYADSIDWAKAKRFNLLGGEPLLIKRSFDILHKLLHAGNTDCRVSFVTNGSVVPSKEQISLIKQFSDISCCVSIDGIDKTFEYLRYPLSWQALLKNLDLYREIFSEVVVSFTVSNLNYHEKDAITSWFKQMGLLYIENYVITPRWFHYEVTPTHELWPRFIEDIKTQDNLKGIKIDDYLPRIAELIKER